MKSKTGLLTSFVAFVCVFGVVGKPAAAMEETAASSLNLQHYNVLDPMAFDDSLPAKRAYTYVSEYKRLPVYNFGIGKRWIDNEDKRERYSFGLGKRSRQYSFGLGKRNENSDYPDRLGFDYVPVSGLAFHSPDNFADLFEGKRAVQPYSFGLGKRAAQPGPSGDPAAGNGKRPNDLFSQRYHFGLGKRMSDEEEESAE